MALVLHVIVPSQPVAVNVAFSPSQHTVLSVLITGADGGLPVLIVTVLLLPEVPQLLLHVAVYVPAPTSIVVPVAPVLHVTVPVQLVAVKVAVSVPHTSVLLEAIVGADGGVPVVIVTVLLLAEVPHTLYHTAV